ncbi:MAG: histidine phosphatase family protein [Actinomycetota bacterium]|nr:histidine phosphatase family protein [Actinomycetota bacterium]
MRRLLLIRHAPTQATQDAAFPLDEPLDEAARGQAARLGDRLPRHATVLCSPALRCAQTAAAAGLEATEVPDLAECDFGAWGGRTLAEVHEREPDAVQAWMTDPDARPHGGESLAAFARRVAGWLDAHADGDGHTVAVTHGGVVRAAVIHALGAPLDAFWRIDASPLGITELHAHGGRWTVARVNSAAEGRSSDPLPATPTEVPPCCAS